MRIVTEGKVYVQKNDLLNFVMLDLSIPNSIMIKFFCEGDVFTITNNDRYDFIAFDEENDMEFFKKHDWIIDYNVVKDMSEQNLIVLYENLCNEGLALEQELKKMTEEELNNNQDLVTKYHLLAYKTFSLKDFIWFKKGKIPMTLPEEIDYPEGMENKKNPFPKKLKSLWEKIKNGNRKHKQ